MTASTGTRKKRKSLIITITDCTKDDNTKSELVTTMTTTHNIQGFQRCKDNELPFIVDMSFPKASRRCLQN